MKQGQKIQGAQALSSLIKKIIKPVYDEKLSAINKLKINWPLIVGDEIAAKASPKKVIGRKQGEELNNILVIEVYDNSFAIELEHGKDIIIEKISAYYGFEPVSDIKIIQKPVSRK